MDDYSIEGLLAVVADPYHADGPAAAEALVRRGRVVVPGLIDLLDSVHPEVRRRAVRALAQLEDPRAVRGLVRLLNDDQRDLRIEAAAALRPVADARALGALLEALESDDMRLRQQAAYALGRIGDPLAMESLLDALTLDPSALVQVAAATALAEIGGQRALQGLVALLATTTNLGIRGHVVRTLKAFGSRAVPVLIQVLASDHPSVRADAARILGELGDPLAVPALRALLHDPNPMLHSYRWNPVWRHEPVVIASWALRQIGTPAALAALEEWRRSQRK